jgi:hypothetical protein
MVNGLWCMVLVLTIIIHLAIKALEKKKLKKTKSVGLSCRIFLFISAIGLFG